jgi:putative heme-binding domain-containing protein
MRPLLQLFILLLLARTVTAQPLVATTEPVSPAEQQKLFKLPPGFEIELVASEPDINKPMNMKFDVHGRLWVSHSIEYPFAATSEEAARDAITIFPGATLGSKPGVPIRFAEHLNIPIGLLPLSDREALAWSIPNIYRLTDTNGDGRADQRTVLFGPFGVIDTHGDQNAFNRWIDGWVYANHGFNNQSDVQIGGKGDVVLRMHSGNTYRYRADGSAIEQFAWGQVNPFGLCFDPLGNLFTADCHSRAVTMVLREGYYSSFGKPHDGLGFAPDTTDMDHGGSGMAAVSYYAADQFPEDFRGSLFVGNVVTNRVHCDRLAWNGSSPRVAKVEDFLTCEDPWFRPVDIQLGPDGALYIADFYNRIIGHYEVPLTHPGRDHERGRIWRVVYRGPKPPGQPAGSAPGTSSPGDLAKLDAPRLVELLGHPNITVRTLATNELLDRFGAKATAAASDVLALPAGKTPQAAGKPTTDRPIDRDLQRAHALWVVQRTAGLDQPLARRLADDPAHVVRVHLVQAIGETVEWQPWQFEIVRGRLKDSNAFVRRAAATALAMHPSSENIGPLASVLVDKPSDDPQLIHATRIALRDQIRSPAVAERLATLQLDAEQSAEFFKIAPLVASSQVALYLFEQALAGRVDRQVFAAALPAAAQSIDSARLDELVRYLREHFADDHERQIRLLKQVCEALARRGIRPTPFTITSLGELLGPIIGGDFTGIWTDRQVPGAAPSASPWVRENRHCQDGASEVPVISSLREHNPVGERLTGVLRSPPFMIPPRLTFWLCGHNGPPNGPDTQKSFARLILSDGTEVARSYPPRNDVAQPYEWDLSRYAGSNGVLELVDGDAGDAYCWIAIARISAPVPDLPDYPTVDRDTARADAVRLAGELRIEALAESIQQIAVGNGDAALRLVASEALAALRPADAILPLNGLLGDANATTAARQRAAELLGAIDRSDAATALLASLRTAPQPVAVAIATALAAKNEGAMLLLAEIRAGRAAATLLREPTVVNRLKSANIDKLDDQLVELTAKLSPADDRIGKLIEERRAGFLAGTADVEAGRAVFARSVCKSCHKIGDVGATIGPALDSIGVRGLDRLLEDVLDPNRNVDQAFRVTSLETESGQIVSGFNLREEGETVVLFDSTGKTIQLPRDEIASRTASLLSPMPANVSEILTPKELYDLMAFLLSQRPK